MDKSRMTFTFRPTPKPPVKETKPFRGQPAMPYKKERFQRPFFRKKAREYVRNRPNKPSSLPGGGTWLLPALLAAVTGIALGLGVLFVFKNGASDLHPTVTTVGPQPIPGSADSPVSLPGIQLTTYQVGVYKELERAKKGVSEFEKLGISPVLRSSDGYQLLVGVALDKSRGQSVADALTQARIPYYAKEYMIAEKKGAMHGIAGKDAATLASVLTQGVQLLKNGIDIVTDPAKKTEAGEWQQKVQAFASQADMARKILEKAEKKGELMRFNDMTEQLQGAAASMTLGKDLLAIERQLVQSLVNYEELINKLIP